jgi:hypothetical protein
MQVSGTLSHGAFHNLTLKNNLANVMGQCYDQCFIRFLPIFGKKDWRQKYSTNYNDDELHFGEILIKKIVTWIPDRRR